MPDCGQTTQYICQSLFVTHESLVGQKTTPSLMPGQCPSTDLPQVKKIFPSPIEHMGVVRGRHTHGGKCMWIINLCEITHTHTHTQAHTQFVNTYTEPHRLKHCYHYVSSLHVGSQIIILHFIRVRVWFHGVLLGLITMVRHLWQITNCSRSSGCNMETCSSVITCTLH